ncbi:lysoplasmalogenase family protein [Flavobacterium facile]|uniref:lysoplasmalogenase family protein n=1 Tax=Flavobacterium facile TaxID=2893174 RepID=UPI002E790BBC|nr:lysoplasmalogenase family protein [Flavobacterium sp. T-12]
MSKKTILYTFIVVCILYFFSALLQLDSLEILVKPLFLPILLFFYIKKAKDKYQNRVIVSFIFYYIGEMLVLNDEKNYYVNSVCFFLIPYLILLYFVVRDLIPLLKSKGYNKINVLVVFVLLFLVFLYVSIMSILETESLFEKILLDTYGFVLLLLGFFAIALYLLEHSVSNLFLVMTVIAFILSDMFYIFIVKVEYNWVFKSVNVISQLLSYYFFVTFSLIKAKGK